MRSNTHTRIPITDWTDTALRIEDASDRERPIRPHRNPKAGKGRKPRVEHFERRKARV